MAQAPQKKPKAFTRRDLGLVAIIAIVIIGLIVLVSRNANQPDELTLNDFYTYVEQGNVTEIYVTPAGSGANDSLYDVSGKYTVGGVPKTFTITIDIATLDWVREQALNSPNIKMEILKLSEFDWLSLIYILGTVVFVIIILFMFFRGANNSNKQAFDFAKSRARLNRQKTTTFKDVAGADEEKEEMQEIIDFLKNPRKYYEMGARVPKGILLVGSPGTGKT
jgi:cell division protease FtsH